MNSRDFSVNINSLDNRENRSAGKKNNMGRIWCTAGLNREEGLEGCSPMGSAQLERRRPNRRKNKGNLGTDETNNIGKAER